MSAARTTDRLPFHCQPTELFAAAVVAELVVTIIHLHGWEGRTLDWQHFDLRWFSQISLFAQWVVLLSSLMICWLRPWLLRLPGSLPVILAFQIAPLVTALSTLGLFVLDRQLQLSLSTRLPEPGKLIIVNTLTVLLVSGAFFRYLYLRADWQARIQAEARARFEALQARIRPHFLFNSINTVASLIPVDAEKAEETLLDLTQLFRAALQENQGVHRLQEEWTLLEHYLRIEKLRLGERLQVAMDLQQDIRDCRVPALLLQPLVENAVYHGIETLPEGGTIRISARCEDRRIRLEVRNPGQGQGNAGLGMAQNNIRQRLQLYFHGKASMQTEQQADAYSVILWLPVWKDDEQDTDRR